MNNTPRPARSTAVVSALGGAAAVAVLAAVIAIVGIIGRGPAAATSSLDPSGPPVAAAASASAAAASAQGSAAPSAALHSAGPPAPSSRPTSTPAPTPVPVVSWSEPARIAELDGCYAVVAAIDDLGTRHLAAQCGSDPSEIRYAVSTHGATWRTTVLPPPSDRLELEPQLAFSGRTLYLAYTIDRATEGACGDDGLEDLGVYYRTRTLPNGSWSAPTRFGQPRDHLQGFRVAGSAIHATVWNEANGGTYYETVIGGTSNRYAIADAEGGTSLRVGDDGRGRIAYASRDGISYGSVANGAFSSRLLPNSSRGQFPSLALAPGNVAWIAYTRAPRDGGGCVSGDDDPVDGTYVATNASGTWVSTRLTTIVGGASLTIDARTGEIHVVVGDFRRLLHYRRLPSESTWRHETIVGVEPAGATVKQDPTTGALFVAYGTYPEDEDSLSLVFVVSSR